MSDRSPGCGDNSCLFSSIRPNGGMRTNGGCRCFKNLELNTYIVAADMSETTVPYDNREAVWHLRNSVMTLMAEYRKLKKEYENQIK
jgi:hypothetical protein